MPKLSMTVVISDTYNENSSGSRTDPRGTLNSQVVDHVIDGRQQKQIELCHSSMSEATAVRFP